MPQTDRQEEQEGPTDRADREEQEDQTAFFQQRVASVLYVEQKLQESGLPYYLLTSYEEGIVSIIYDNEGQLN